MGKRSRILWIVGAAAIGVIALIIVMVSLIVSGVLDVTQNKLVIASSSEEFVYDGEEHTSDDWYIAEGGLKDGHYIVASVTGSQTDVGSSYNYVSVFVYDSNDTDVTEDYQIEYQPGTLTVVASTLIITTSSAEKMYDGTPLTADTQNDWQLAAGKLSAGHTLNVTLYASITNVGSVDNGAYVYVTNANGSDCTKNYDITVEAGILTVRGVQITISTSSAEKIYDGTPLTANTEDDWEYISGDLFEGHTLSVTVYGSQTDAGSSDNSAAVYIYDSNGVNCTNIYEITCDCGTLTVDARNITVISGDAVKEYDGTPLTCEDYTWKSISGLLEGHELEVLISGTRTYAGISENTIADVQVYYLDVYSNKVYVTYNYNINYQCGWLYVKGDVYEDNHELEVGDNDVTGSEEYTFTAEDYGTYTFYNSTGSDLTITDAYGNYTWIESGGQSSLVLSEGDILYVYPNDGGVITIEAGATYYGDSLDISGDISGDFITGGVDTIVAFSVYSDVSGLLYFKILSYGDYSGQSWNAANDYYELIDGTYSMSYLFGLALAEAGYSEAYIQIQDYSGNYLLPFQLSTTLGDCDVQTSDVYYTGSSSFYTLYAYYYDYFSNGTSGLYLPDAYTALEEAYSNYVYSNYLSVPYSTLVYLNNIIAEQNFDTSDTYTTIYQVINYIKNAATYNLEYDSSLNYESDIVVAFLDTYQEGICQHFASAATLLLRAMGIPARYVQGYVGSTVAGEWSDVTSATAHAWVEVYIDGLGWVTVDATPGGAGGGSGSGSEGGGSGSGGGGGESEDGTLYEGDNAVEGEGEYTFTADEDGEYTFFNDTDGDMIITDGNGNETVIESGGTGSFEMNAGESLGVYTEGGGNVEIDGTGFLYEGGNSVEADGDYTFTADAYGEYTIYNGTGGDMVITGDFGYTIISSGDYATFELAEGEVLGVYTNGSGSVYIGEGLSDFGMLHEGDNAVMAEGEYIFTADENGTYTFTNSTGSDMIVADTDGNYTIIADGGSFDFDLAEGESLGIYTQGGGSVTIDFTGTLYEGDNAVTGEGNYTFTADGEGTFTFTNGTGGDMIVTDGSGNETVIASGETGSFELAEGESLDVYTEGDGNVTVGEDLTGTAGNLDMSGLLTDGDFGESSDVTVLKVYSDVTGTLYLKNNSFGDYINQVWYLPNDYSELIDGEYSMSYLLGLALAQAGYSDTLIQIENYSTDYLLPYQLSTASADYEVQTSDVLYSGSTFNYSVYAYYYDYLTNGTSGLSLPAEYTALEEAYRSYVYDNYMGVPDSTLEYLNTIIAKQQFNTDNVYTLATQVVNYIQNAATYNLYYDRSLNYEDDIVVAFLSEYKEGICQHFARAATLLFRALGVPARYTQGYVASTVAGTWVDVTGATAHAWVEIYIDGLGWVTVDATPGGAGGGSESSGGNGSAEITDVYKVSPYTERYAYDGDEHFYSDTELKGLDDLTDLGYTYTFTVEGSRTDYGITVTVITSFTLYDPYGKDVTNELDIELKTGKLQVYYAQISVTTGSASKVYDGTALTCDVIYVDSSTLAEGHTVVYSTSGTITTIGQVSNGVSLTVYDENGEDVTDWYWIKTSYGTLKVTACEITVTAASVTASYDGSALTCSDYVVEGLPEGFTVQATVTGSQTKPGRADNVITSVTVYDENGKDVTSNFAITTVDGKLTVTR
ncbi:MAG: hypothetical protein LUD19_00125 [Clostridia bacterium]|nr:hypothetical protein [Clostridia bacterium]